MTPATALAWLSLVAFLLWVGVVWRLRDHLRRHERIHSVVRDMALFSLLVALLSPAVTGFLHGRELTGLIDVVALTARSAAMSAGVVALWATRRPE